MMPHTPYWIFEQKPDSSYQVEPQAQTMLNELVAHAKKYGPSIFHEMGIPPAEYEKNMQAYFDRGVSLSGTKVKSITYATPYSPSYAADGPNTLIDGVFGTNNYFALWLGWWGKDVEATLELKETQKVREVRLNCLDNSQSWILAPSDIIVSFSTDGKEFKQIGEVKNPKAGQKLEKQSILFTIPLNKGKGVVAKYIRVFCKNQGKMPKWTGVVDGDTWVFIDEIEVN
jgi:hexosaminidase